MPPDNINNMHSMEKKTKAVIYARVSSREQEETGYSLDAQEDLLKNYTERNGLDVVKFFRISESASGKRQRATFSEMINYLSENKVDVLVCEKVDRLTRNFKDAIVIDDWLEEDKHRQVHLVKDSLVMHQASKSQEKLNWGIRLLFAKNYTDNLSEEVKKGQLQKAQQGWLPTKPPLGYKTIGDKGHKIHIIDEEVAPYIKMMFDMYLTGNHSTASLVDELYALGFRSRTGNRVVKSRIHKLLQDPFFYGDFRWKGKIYQGKHDPIISKDQFDRTQAILKRPSAPYKTKHTMELKGKIRCVECSRTVSWEQQKGHWYGACKHCKAQLSEKGKYAKYNTVVSQILDRIEAIAPANNNILKVLEKALIESHREDIDNHQSRISGIQASLERIKQRKRSMYNDKLDGRIDNEFYDEKLSEFNSEEQALLNSLSKIENSEDVEYYQYGIDIHRLALEARSIYKNEHTTVEERKEILCRAFSHISLSKGEITSVYTKGFAFLAEWMPKINKTLEPLLNDGIQRDLRGNTDSESEIQSEEKKKFRTTDYPYVSKEKGTFVPDCPILLRR